MRMAWPELIVLIVVAALGVLAVEIAILFSATVLARWWLIAAVALTAVALDVWAALRLVDWLFAGPARRRKDRIIRFSP